MCIFVICDKHRLTMYTYVNLLLHQTLKKNMSTPLFIRDRRGRDRMVVGFTTTLLYMYLCNQCLSQLTL